MKLTPYMDWRVGHPKYAKLRLGIKPVEGLAATDLKPLHRHVESTQSTQDTAEDTFSRKSTTPSTSARSKRCSKCGDLRPITDYPKHDTSSDGHAAYCTDCKNDLAKERRLKDPIARITHYTITRIKNEWPKEEIPKDIQTNLEGYLGYRLYELKRKLSEEVMEMYGITLVESFKRDFHLDHIQPHSSFHSEVIGDEEFKKCWAISNLRMIPAQENLQKGAKLDFYT